MTEKELRVIFNSKKRREIKNKNGTIKEIAGFSPECTFEDFFDWYSQETFDKGCYYSKTTNERSYELYLLRPNATRGGKRGKRLELNRLNPNLPYDNLDNLVWCCYWCNNAKTNFFSEKEFRSIGKAIGKILKKLK